MTVKKSLLIWALVSLTVVMATFYGVLVSKNKINEWLSNGDNLFWSLSQKIPEDLEVKIKNGEVTINKERPYCLQLVSKSGLGIYFSNSENPSLPKKNECDASITVGKDYMVMPEDDGSYRVYKVDETVEAIINRTIIENFYRNNSPVIEKVAWIIFYGGSWLGWLTVFGWGLLNCLWFTWIAKLALKIFQSRKELIFVQVFGVSLFLMSGWWFLRYGLVSLILNNYFHKNIELGFPFMNTLILTVLALIWYKMYDKKGIGKK